jgi:hypothetical protein
MIALWLDPYANRKHLPDSLRLASNPWSGWLLAVPGAWTSNPRARFGGAVEVALDEPVDDRGLVDRAAVHLWRCRRAGMLAPAFYAQHRGAADQAPAPTGSSVCRR